MAFDNVTFPTIKLIHGIRKEVVDPISIVTNGQSEYRIKKNQWEKYVWSLPGRAIGGVDKNEIQAFLAKRSSSLNSFKFVDPEQNTLVDAPMSWSSTSWWKLNIPFDSVNPGTHPILHPDVGTLTAEVNAVPTSINAFAIVSGQPLVQILGTFGGETVTVSGSHSFAVRLDSPIAYILAALDVNNAPIAHILEEISLVEVFVS